MAIEAARCIQIRTWLQARHPLLTLHSVGDQGGLQRRLNQESVDFVVVVPPRGSNSLPEVLRAAPQVHTLVLVESAAIGPLPDWFYQGADAVSSLFDTDALRSSLDALVHASVLRRRLILLRSPGNRQSAMLRGLMCAKSSTPVCESRGARFVLRPQFARTTHPLIDDAGQIDAPALRSWLALAASPKQSPTTGGACQRPPDTDAQRPTVSGDAGSTLGSEALRKKRGEVGARRRLKADTRLRVARLANREARDFREVARRRIEERVQNLLQTRQDTAACSALRLHFSGTWEAPSTQRQRSRLELGISRATRTLRSQLNPITLIERPRLNALILLQPGDPRFPGGLSAPRVRHLLGSLGGLIGSASDLRIHTLNMAMLALTASELLAWLDEL